MRNAATTSFHIPHSGSRFSISGDTIATQLLSKSCERSPMKRTNAKQSVAGNPLRRAAARLRRMFSRAEQPTATRGDGRDVETPIATMAEVPREGAPAIHRPHATSDVPLDQLATAYQPAQTSLKSSFRADGADRERDQEYVTGAGDGTWNDEDRFTNRSGDPRIGTHGRTYEPGERVSRNED